MRLTSVFTCLSVLVAAASALTIPLDVRGYGDDSDLSVIAARDAADVVAPIYERDLDFEDDLLERSFFDNIDDLLERDSIYDDLLEVRKGPKPRPPPLTPAEKAAKKAARPPPKRPARVAASKARATPQNKKDRKAVWDSKNKGSSAAKRQVRNDAFKARWAAKPENAKRKWKKNLNGKGPVRDFSKKGQPGQKVFWSQNARNDLNKLGLTGKDRRKVKNFHKNLAKASMKANPGANTAEIYQLAHKNTSPHDKRLHATGKLFNAKGNLMPPAGYTPPPGSPAPRYTHMYAHTDNVNTLPAAMKNAYLAKNPGKTLADLR